MSHLGHLNIQRRPWIRDKVFYLDSLLQSTYFTTHTDTLHKVYISPTQSHKRDFVWIHNYLGNGKKGWMCVFLETDRGWSLKTQTSLITACHNSGFGFKSCVLQHQSPWSLAQLALASKIRSPLPVCAEVFFRLRCLRCLIQACRALLLLLWMSFVQNGDEGLFVCLVAQGFMYIF